MKIRPLHSSDLPMLSRHEFRHSKENWRDGDFIFAPNEEEYFLNEDDIKKQAAALDKTITAPGWLRVWVLTDESEIWGALTLTHRPALKAALHRCLLMMGLERTVRSQGWGSKLLEEAIIWARQQPTLDWITLNVFENNLPAKTLYQKFGFHAVGTTKDLFRVFGTSIDDTEMVLKLR